MSSASPHSFVLLHKYIPAFETITGENTRLLEVPSGYIKRVDSVSFVVHSIVSLSPRNAQ